jgi:anti-sigma B factor antagonist
MKILVEKKEDAIRYAIEGKVDERCAEILKEKFRSTYKESLKKVVFDFKNVTHIGSAGIGKLLLFYKDVAINDGTIVIEHISPVIYDLFATLKLDTVFSLKKA